MNECNCLKITSGKGPKECGWVVTKISEKILEEATKNNFSCEIVESVEFEKGNKNIVYIDSFKSVVIRISGKGVNTFINKWEGIIKWQGESMYRSKHKRSNWFIEVLKIEQFSTNSFMITNLKNEVKIDAIKSKGPGGQHVNKTDSAIRLTHIPTGLQVRVESERSQHRNKKLAFEQLHQLLNKKYKEKNEILIKDRWSKNLNLERGNPKRIFIGRSFKEKKIKERNYYAN